CVIFCLALFLLNPLPYTYAYGEGKIATPLNTGVIDLTNANPNAKDGHAAAKEIRLIEKEWGVSINDGVPILVLSSLNTPHDVIQAYVSARSAAHLVKPVHPDKLLGTLSKLGICK
nr:hypothetical protein [Pseudomonadota bacterium]